MKRGVVFAGAPLSCLALALTLGACNNESVDLLAVEAPRIAYADTIFAWRAGATDTLVPSASGGEVFLWSVAPALPAGLKLDSLAGTIAGTPVDTTASVKYTVTAKGPGGNGTAAFTLKVLADTTTVP